MRPEPGSVENHWSAWILLTHLQTKASLYLLPCCAIGVRYRLRQRREGKLEHFFRTRSPVFLISTVKCFCFAM